MDFYNTRNAALDIILKVPPCTRARLSLGYMPRIATAGLYRMKIINFYYLMPPCFQNTSNSNVQESSG